MSLAFLDTDVMWRNAVAVLPLALLIAAICRCLPCRPATRHALWLIALVSLLAPPMLPAIDLSRAVDPLRLTIADDKAPGNAKPPSARPVEVATPREPSLEPAAAIPDCPTTPPPAALRSSAGVPNPPPTYQAGTPSSKPAPSEPRLPRTMIEAEPAWAFSGGDAWTRGLPRGDAVVRARSEPVLQPRQALLERPAVTASNPALRVGGASKADAIQPGRNMPPVASSNWSNEITQWFSGLLTVRDAVRRLTPVPSFIWFSGSAVLVAILAVRIIRFRRLLRSASAAPGDVRALVLSASQAIGLRSPPSVLMTSRRISPLIWCGRQRLLLLPAQLWAELDGVGRRAIVLHELAHLKRRDHWVCWTELVVGCLYWWHPVVWWIRRRLRDEADFCCDSWVIALLPGGRSAYARALLSTRQYLNAPHDAVPVVGLGVTTTRTKCFARRLTMVMTARSMPRLSMCGGALALCLAAGAWLATPLWACPPDESAACDPATPKPAKAPKVAKAPKAPRAVVVQPRTTPAPPGTTFEAYMEGRPAPHDDDVRQRLDQLEQRLNRLTEHLEALSGQQGGGGTLRRQPAPMAGALVPGQHGLPEQQLAERRAMAGQNAALGFARAQTGQTVVKVYRLPPDKRDSLYQFMARNDVPILVGQADEGIEVHATPHQHEIFGLFFELVHPESGAQGGGSSAAPAQQTRIHAMAKAYEEAARAAVQRINRPEVQEKVKQHIEEAMRSYHSQHQSLHDRMHQLHQKAEELHKRAIELQQEAAELESKAGEKDKDAERDAALAKAEALQSEADALMEQADAEHEAADSVQELMDELQEQLDEAIAEAEEAAEEAETEESEEDADEAN